MQQNLTRRLTVQIFATQTKTATRRLQSSTAIRSHLVNYHQCSSVSVRRRTDFCLQQQRRFISTTTRVFDKSAGEEMVNDDGKKNAFAQPTFSESDEQSYSKTMEALDYLILKIPPSVRPPDTRQNYNIEAMADYMRRLDMHDYSQLPPVIHVAGTKGKGSTCAFCESILRSCGYKTGLYTSPHLIDVRERIRINGKPVDKLTFMKNFWYCYRRLINTTNETFPSMATYFRFLTVLAMRIFAQEGVDVAILEVGIGGMYDATTLFTPVVCGISSIGMDHTDLLGDSIDKIAMQKAGIMKNGVPCITIQDQRNLVKRCFYNYAHHSNYLTQNYATYFNMNTSLNKNAANPLFEADFNQIQNLPKNADMQNQLLGSGVHQEMNAALAIALCEFFIYLSDRNKRLVLLPATVQKIKQLLADAERENRDANSSGIEMNEADIELTQYSSTELSNEFLNGVINCTWPGRAHVIAFEKNKISFYVDGAHTDDSIYYCAQWFKQKSSQLTHTHHAQDQELVLDAISSDEDIRDLKHKILKHQEQKVTSNETTEEKKPKRVLVFNYTGFRDPRELLKPLVDESSLFTHVVFVPIDSQKISLAKKSPTDNSISTGNPQLASLRDLWLELSTVDNKNTSQQVITMDNINSFLEWVFAEGNAHVLVTGSFYMVGDFIRKLSKLSSS